MDAMPSDVTGGWVCRRSCRTDFFEGRRIFLRWTEIREWVAIVSICSDERTNGGTGD